MNERASEARALTVAYTPYHADDALGRLAARRGQLSDTDHAEVVSRLGWAAGELGYPARP